MNKKKIGIFWMREDFRLIRNFALSAASKNHENIVVLYVYKENKFKDKNAQRWWIFNSLTNFRSELSKHNINLQIIKSDTYKSFFEKLLNKNDFCLYWNKIYEPQYLKFDQLLKQKLSQKDIEYKVFKGNILNEFNEIKKSDQTPFKVFTPFWRTAEKFYSEKIPSQSGKIEKNYKKINYFNNEFDEANILPNKKWYKKFEVNWEVNEKTALNKLQTFLKNNLNEYSGKRNFPNISGTSKLSPYIKHGHIHVETIWHETLKAKMNKNNSSKFLAEIGWREFSHSLINFFPNMIKSNYSKKFDKFPWKKNEKFLEAWKNGLTGYPIVDAGMREMYQTGWMHNRVRMIVGSFLVKHLLIHWKEGEKHFRDCLLDFSEANNISGWQWVAGCGADAAPYFRIFNPILQGEKFDKEGDYVKKWIPEIREVPRKYIHKPWEYSESKKFKIGISYPNPIVDHQVAREKALNAFKKIK